MRIIGMDIHRSFAQVAILEDGQITRQLRVELLHGPVIDLARTLSLEDDVVLEATGNSAAVERLLRPHVRRVVVANSRLVRAIAYVRVKTDKIDAAILAKLHAAGFLPEVWIADDATLTQRRQRPNRNGKQRRPCPASPSGPRSPGNGRGAPIAPIRASRRGQAPSASTTASS
jgi:hypothetical protein